MSFSRGSIQELCDIIENKPSVVLGNKFFDTRLVIHIEFAQKTDKYESRFLVISKFRLFLLSGKNASSLKIDRSYHILHIKSVCVLSENETALMVDENGSRKRILIKGYPGEDLALAIIKTLKHYFPDICALLPRVVEFKPSDLYDKADAIVLDISPRPCHSFRRTYAALCDLHDQPYRDEVAWDVEKIYTANRITDLRMEDFSHLLPKDLPAIVSVLQYSSYFTGLIIDGLRLSTEMIDVILGVVKYSLSLKRLILSNCGLTREFPGLLAASLSDNEKSGVEMIDLSRNNTLDDRKGFTALSSSLSRLSNLSYLNLSECSLSEKSSQQLCSSLYGVVSASSSSSKGIVHLNISNSIMKDDISSLINLLSLSTSLRSLDLSDCHTPLDKLWPALKYGCLQLESLSVSGCITHSGKKPTAESTTAAKFFFSASVGLKKINMSRIQLNHELLKSILDGLASNHQLDLQSLNLDGSCDKLGGVLEECIPPLKVHRLSLRDCHLENDLPGVIQSISRMPCLVSLSIGGANVVGLKKNSKTAPIISRAMNELVKLMTTSTTLEELSIADAHLGTQVSMLINSLGACTNIRSLDLSANDLGNFGMRILSKALELNTSLRHLSIDNNHLGVEGMSDLAFAMEENLSLQSIPCPFNDINEAFQRGADRVKISHNWSRVESSLERNRRGDLIYDIARKKSSYHMNNDEHDDIINHPPTQMAIDQFIDKIGIEGSRWIGSILGGVDHCNGDVECTSSNRERDRDIAEKHALTMLKESIERDVYSSLSEWLYKEMVNSKNLDKRAVKSADRRTMGLSGRSGTPHSDCASPSPVYRPRSILTEMKNFSVDGSGVSIDGGSGDNSLIDILGPPTPSNLSHPSKSRPRPLRKKVVQNNLVSVPPPPLSYDDDRTSSPTDSLGSSTIDNRPNESSRSALLPPSSPISSCIPIEECPSPISTTLSTSSIPLSLSQPQHSPPPPLPKRHTATPPILPPKPDKLVRETSRDESPSGSRRSVADMARLFSR